MKDLFETPELIPADVQEVLNKYETGDELDYQDYDNLIKDLELIGYTCDYGLDAEVYDLRKLDRFKTAIDFILDRSGSDTAADIELIRSTYNAYPETYRELILDMYAYKGFVYVTTVEHKPKSETYLLHRINWLTFSFETRAEMHAHIDTLTSLKS